MSFFKFLFISLIFFLLLISCEKYTGFDFTGDVPAETAKIYGLVKNTFTNEPVAKARVTFGNYTTYTDKLGNYSIFYPIQTSEQRDQPIPVTVEAINFYPYQAAVILYPNSNELNVALEYGAPIIRQNAFVSYTFHQDPIYVCQALVIDYQGITDIDSVWATFYFESISSDIKTVNVKMDRISDVSDTEAYYQCIISVTLGDWDLRAGYDITAIDREGFSNSISDASNAMAPDKFLFPPGF